MTMYPLSPCRQTQHSVQFYADMGPAVRQVLREKEQAVMALQETVEVYMYI